MIAPWTLFVYNYLLVLSLQSKSFSLCLFVFCFVVDSFLAVYYEAQTTLARKLYSPRIRIGNGNFKCERDMTSDMPIKIDNELILCCCPDSIGTLDFKRLKWLFKFAKHILCSPTLISHAYEWS
ncbi:hypothetical protein F5Y14DRAFT_367284 [Nemania sp. NC0429]|nr:hypothetical protein F5Y14DRAFT_367284 [Nemania sp. NC0429]